MLRETAVISNCVLVTNLPFKATKTLVIQRLVQILHSQVKINFDFQFLYKKNSDKHLGKGILILPQKEHVIALLGLKMDVLGMTVQFQADAKPPSDYELILERIQNEPWSDTSAEEATMDDSIATQKTIVEVDYCHFGRFCWDQVFSLEYEWKQKLFVKSEDGDVILAPKDELLTRAVIKTWTIKELIVDTRQNIVMILLNLPITYEGSISNATYYATKSNEIRMKQSCIAPDHYDIAPFVSTGLTLWFKNPQHLSTFLMFVDRLHIKAKKQELTFEIRNLYSGKRLETVKSWLRSLPLALGFQCELLLRSLVIDPCELLAVKAKLEKVFANRKTSESLSFLLCFRQELENGRLYDFDDSTCDLHECFERALNDHLAFKPKSYSEELIQCFQIVVTPTTFYLDGPFPDQANRVLRLFPQYRNNFVRVSFSDEEHLSLRFGRDEDKESYVQQRVVQLLKNGIELYHGRYEFLGYSNSGLRERSVYFMHPFRMNEKLVNAEGIRGILGDFSKEIHFPARYGARLAQAFTTTNATVRLKPDQLKEIPDVVINGSTFTDGVGVISKELADKIFSKLSRYTNSDESPPSAYQIRLGGLKGVVSVNPDLKGGQLLWRPSMKKFDADHFLDFEVARAFTKPGKVTLNRPLIKILEDLGVPTKVFLQLQNDAIQQTKNSFENIQELGNLLMNHNLGLSFQLKRLFEKLSRVLEMEASTLLSDAYETLPAVFQTAVNHALRDLKYSSKIPVPDSYSFVGVADEFGYLKPDEVYACAFNPLTGVNTYIEGPVCIYRCPTLHPGDVQMVRAIGKIPDHINVGLKHLRNVVVFSVHPDSPRSLPSCLAGGDLDGDEYCLVLNRNLHPQKRANASAYEPAEKKRSAKPCTIADVADFVGNFILSDMVGMVATRHLIMADMSPHGTRDPGCIKLAELASLAVDFPKSGTPVPMNAMPKLPEDKRPDYLCPEVIGRGSTCKYYKSEKAIGILFRSVDILKKKQVSLSKRMKQLKVMEDTIDDPITVAILHLKKPESLKLSIELHPREDHFAREFVSRFNKEFIVIAKTNSMVRGKVLTEAEVLVCSILDPSRQPRKRKSLMNAMRLQTQELFRRIQHDLETTDVLQTVRNCWYVWVFSRKAKAYGTESIGLIALNILLDNLERVI